jgi:hypothetical protein
MPRLSWLYLLLAAALPAFPQTFTPFHLDQDALGGAADFSWLNRALTPDDRITVGDGHFVNMRGERVRFFGVNLCFGANFPLDEDAPRIARRLRRMGVNLVRLHHLDSQPDPESNPERANSTLTTGRYPAFNPVTMARLRALLTAFSEEGIHVNLNIHVGYTFRPEIDEVPALPDGRAFPRQSKPLHMVHPLLVERQAEYARGLIGRLELPQDDPTIAMVELNNETSLVYAYQNGSLDAELGGDYVHVFNWYWNDYLRRQYATTAALREAWGASTPDGASLLPAEWRPLEIHPGAQASLTVAGGVARVHVTNGASTVILKKVGFSVEEGKTYAAEVEIRADVPCSVYWDVKQDVSPWRTAASRTISVTTEWQKFRMGVTPQFGMDGIGRFGLSLAGCPAAVEVRGEGLVEPGLRGLAGGEELTAENIARPGAEENSTEARLNDYLRFLAGRDRVYLETLAAPVRELLPGVPITGTQQGFGGMMLWDSHRALDYTDEHFYIDHYSFPNVAWDGRDWRFRDTFALATGLAALRDVATAAIAGRPYTVSEFNQPWPNTRGAELLPAVATLAAFQDWDGLMHFAYEHGRTWDSGVPHGFNINGDWTKAVQFGQAAMIVRLGLIRPGEQEMRLPMPEALRLRHGRERRTGDFTTLLERAQGYDPYLPLRRRVRLDPEGVPEAGGDSGARILAAESEQPDTGEFRIETGPERLLIDAPRAAGVVGAFTPGEPVAAGPLTVELLEGARGFAAVLLTALDGEPLEESERLLLTKPGYTLRTQPGSDPARPQAIISPVSGWYTLEPDQSNKPSGNLNDGARPVWMEQIPAAITLPFRFRAYPLDGAGTRLEPRDAMENNKGWRVVLDPASPWFELVAIRD